MSITMTLDGYAADPKLGLVGSGSTTVAVFPCSRLTLGMSNGQYRNVIITLSMINGSVDYASEITIIGTLKLAAGPTYTFSASPAISAAFAVGGNLYSTITAAITSNNLVVTANLNSVTVDCYATIALKGP